MKKAEDLPEEAEQLTKELTAIAIEKKESLLIFSPKHSYSAPAEKNPLICQTSTAVDAFPTKDEDVAADYSLSGTNKPDGNPSIRIASVHLQQPQTDVLNSDQTGLYERQKQGPLTDEQQKALQTEKKIKA